MSILTQLLAKRRNKSVLIGAFDQHVIKDAEDNLQQMRLHSLAAAHGHKRTLRKLIAVQEHVKPERKSQTHPLSLEEALAESTG